MKELTLEELKTLGYSLNFNKNGGLSRPKVETTTTVVLQANDKGLELPFIDKNAHLPNIDLVIYNNAGENRALIKNEKKYPYLKVFFCYSLTILIIYAVIKLV